MGERALPAQVRLLRLRGVVAQPGASCDGKEEARTALFVPRRGSTVRLALASWGAAGLARRCSASFVAWIALCSSSRTDRLPRTRTAHVQLI